jgi:hypothetical protein
VKYGSRMALNDKLQYLWMKTYTKPILRLSIKFKVRVRVLNLMKKMRLKGIYLLMKINERGNCQGEFKIVLRFSNK